MDKRPEWLPDAVPFDWQDEKVLPALERLRKKARQRSRGKTRGTPAPELKAR